MNVIDLIDLQSRNKITVVIDKIVYFEAIKASGPTRLHFVGGSSVDVCGGIDIIRNECQLITLGGEIDTHDDDKQTRVFVAGSGHTPVQGDSFKHYRGTWVD